MADQSLVQLALQGKDAWNAWRKKNPDAPADFFDADFRGDQYQNISFADFDFGDRADFCAAKFDNGVSFEGASFGKDTNFRGAMFGRSANFDNVRFDTNLSFRGALFQKAASFMFSKFGNGADFSGVIFGPRATFQGAIFLGSAKFGALTEDDLRKLRKYIGLRFERGARRNFEQNWDNTRKFQNEFRSTTFARAKFESRVSFAGRKFLGPIDFANAQFDYPPDFSDTKGRERMSLISTRFGFGGRRFLRWTTDPNIATELRRLRALATEIHAIDAERDLFILERMAERGVQWKSWWRGGWCTDIMSFFRPLMVTVSIFLYWLLSNCGRSIGLPALWLMLINVGSYFVYRSMVPNPKRGALIDMTMSSAFPFGALSKDALTNAKQILFCGNAISWQVNAAANAQAILNTILVFLIALALRNHFKVR